MTYMTHDEATAHWCPQASVVEVSPNGQVQTPPHNRVHKQLTTQIAWPMAANCIGEKCMMWRWRVTLDDMAEGGHAPLGQCGLAPSSPFSPVITHLEQVQ